MSRGTKEIKEEILGILKTTEASGRKYVIRVVRWGNGKPSLEKREQYETEDGETRSGKAKGFNKEDFSLILEKKDQILELLEGEKGEKEKIVQTELFGDSK